MFALALLMTGYSVFASLQIAITHFASDSYREQRQSQVMGTVLLAALGCLQLAHFVWLQFDWPLIAHPVYLAMLFAVAPSFYLFSTPLLKARVLTLPHAALHAAPVVLGPLLSDALARPVAFLLGAGYLLALGIAVHALRAERTAYRRELALLGLVFVIALFVTILALGWLRVPERLFIELYAIAIGTAFLLVNIALARAPQLSLEVSDLAQQTYARSTLGQVDVDAALERLASLMREHKPYRDPALDLRGLAQRVGLSAHQLSELVNSRLGKGVSRYIRDYRVADAQALLLEKPSLSVLAVGLEVGFSSQSSFYAAFRESLGMTPGKYREIHRAR
ncbi:MAG: AraC family transcriptional regulator [Gammaproteobacteria bacterium]|nr:AraC family transcriptional regulator [Gammaproteobacteria bacterium]